MINYHISYNNAYRHFIDIKVELDLNDEKELEIQLPVWRPGRYELGNFIKNIQNFNVFNEEDKQLFFEKINKARWRVDIGGSKKVRIQYNYYANELNAGSTYLDENQLYVNPVNCCVFIIGKENIPCRLIMDTPSSYKIGIGLKQLDSNIFLASNFDELADSPFIASNNLLHDSYEIDNIKFHIWVQGLEKVDFKKIKKDFIAFTSEQISCFGSFPVKQYHYLIQTTPYKSYHGVEHKTSTVILLGPGSELTTARYDDFLGVSSHELYHTWNIKTIRPKEMLPYNFSQENYSKLGYVAEGVTTYMGDLMLLRSKVFTWEQFVKTQNENLKRHYENYGRLNLSVADSSFDTWIDGYELGIPNRKSSIYTEGALCMLMIDLNILHNSGGKKSLNDVMLQLYSNYEDGYSEEDFISLCIQLGGDRIKYIFENHVYGVQDYTPTLIQALSYIGLTITQKPNPNLLAKYFGIIAIYQHKKLIIKKIEPNSVADQNKISVEDEIVEINNSKIIDNKFEDLLKGSKSVHFKIKSRFDEKNHTLDKGSFFKIHEIDTLTNISKEQDHLYSIWMSE